MSNTQWAKGVLIGLLTLAILYAGYRIINTQTVDRPLKQHVLAVPGVARVELIKGTNIDVVKVSLKQTDNLAYTYHQIDRVVAERLKKYRLEVSSPENEEAERLFDNLSLYFYGGLARGQFVEMEQTVKALAARQGWQVRIQMDEKRVYVALSKHNRFCYWVIERGKAPLTEEVD